MEGEKQEKFSVGQMVWYSPGGRPDRPCNAVVEKIGRKYVYLVNHYGQFDKNTGVMVGKYGHGAQIITMDEKSRRLGLHS